jgi:hypothetical protein
MPDNTAGADANVLTATQVSYIEFLSRHGGIAGTYLEIGPDIGLSTQAACAQGHIERAILVEPNGEVHDQLKSAVGEIPTEICESLEQLAPDDQADNVVLIHVLDHLIDPLAHLRAVHAHMTKGGLLLAVVHNEASLLRRILGVRWPPFCLQHPQLYNPSTLGKLFSEAGFTVVDSSPTHNIWPLRHLVKVGAAVLGISGSWIEHVPKTRIRMRLGNVMMVVRA